MGSTMLDAEGKLIDRAIGRKYMVRPAGRMAAPLAVGEYVFHRSNPQIPRAATARRTTWGSMMCSIFCAGDGTLVASIGRIRPMASGRK